MLRSRRSPRSPTLSRKPQPSPFPRCFPVGDAAMTVEFGDAIDPTTNARAVAFAEEIRKRAWRGVVDIVPTYRSVTLHVDPLHLNLVALMKRVRCLAAFPVDVRGEGGGDIPSR